MPQGRAYQLFSTSRQDQFLKELKRLELVSVVSLRIRWKTILVFLGAHAVRFHPDTSIIYCWRSVKGLTWLNHWPLPTTLQNKSEDIFKWSWGNTNSILPEEESNKMWGENICGMPKALLLIGLQNLQNLRMLNTWIIHLICNQKLPGRKIYEYMLLLSQ